MSYTKGGGMVGRKSDIQAFVNPDGYWRHESGYKIELTTNAPRENLPASVSVQGDILIVQIGRCFQAMGAIQCVSGEKDEFYFRYSCIKSIRRLDDSLIWVNYDYR